MSGIPDMTMEQRRAGMAAFVRAGVEALSPTADTIEEFEIQIPTHDGWQSRTRIVRPKANVEAKRPLVVQFFGGGFMVGEPDQLLNVGRAFAEKYGAVVALPSYRLMPEVKWPVPHRDGYDVAQWLSENAEEELGANLDAGFIVGGVSAGAFIAVAIGGLAMFPDTAEAQAVPRLAKPLTGQALLVPLVFTEDSVPADYKPLFRAWADNNSVEGSLNTIALKMILNGLDITDYNSMWVSPVPELLKRGPINKFPIYMEHCGFDPLRDDATIYEKILQSRGVTTKTRLFPEDLHASWTVGNRLAPEKTQYFEQAQMEGMKWLLGA